MKKIIFFTLLIATTINCQDDSEFLPFNDAYNVSGSNVACTVDISTQTASVQPVFIRPGTSQFFHPENRYGTIEMTAGQAIELWCSSSWATPAGAPNLITATCVNGQTFNYAGTNMEFNTFKCQSWPAYSTRRISSPRCYNNGIFVDVGFDIGGRWLHIYRSCHDLALEVNWYVYHQFTPIADGNQRNVYRPRFGQADFFSGKTVDNLYTRVTQTATVASILQSTERANYFIEADPSQVFLARGHQAAMTDFILATEQQATFLFINVAPQWQTFNGQNWVAVEISSRKLASDRGIYLDVYSGVFGVTQLWDENNIRHGIFLDWPAAKIPVPQLYYKILVNNANRSGVVLIGVNNPHLSLQDIQTRGYIVCEDKSDHITWVSWQRTDLRRGYSYACDVNDFLARVPHVSGLNVQSLLV